MSGKDHFKDNTVETLLNRHAYEKDVQYCTFAHSDVSISFIPADLTETENHLPLLFLSPATGRLYAMQAGMKLDSKSPECRKFLVKLMDQLESVRNVFNTCNISTDIK